MNTAQNMITITFTASEVDEFVNNNASVEITGFEWNEHQNRPNIDYNININNDWTTTIDAEEYGMVSIETHNELETNFNCLKEEFEVIRQKYVDLSGHYDEIETLNDEFVGVNEGLQNEIDQLKKELADLKSKKKPFWVVW